MKPVHLSTCVWGRWHLDILSRIMWPCILAEGNLPTLVRHCRPLYRISTTRRDQAKMREMPLFGRIAELVDVEFSDAPSEDPEPIFHMEWHFKAVQHARDHGAVYFMLWPDVIYTDRTLGQAGMAIRDGRAGCVLPTIRVISETCMDDVVRTFPRLSDAPMPISPGDVVRLAVRHMHPLSATAAVGAVHGRPDTGMLFRVPGEGIISRSSSTWLFMDPQQLTVTTSGEATTDDSDPLRLIHLVTDSDDMFFLSLAPLVKELEVLRPNHHNEAIDIARMTLHPWLAVSPFYDCFDSVATRLHYGEMTEALWEPVVRHSEAVFRRTRMTRAYLRIWAAVKKEGCLQVARLMSLALFSRKLRSSWLIEQPVTIFVPNDRAIEALPQGAFSRLLDKSGARELIRTMLGHTVPGIDPLPAKGDDAVDRTTLNGQRLHISATEAGHTINETIRIVSDFRSGPHRIYVVDQCLEAPYGRAD